MCKNGSHDGTTQSDSQRACRSVRDRTRGDAATDGGPDGQPPTAPAMLSDAIRRLVSLWGHMLESTDKEELNAIIAELADVQQQLRGLWLT